jgi:hypothetical protein
MPHSMDLPERCCQKGITKPVMTEQPDCHGRQRGRIRNRSRPVCCPSCLLPVLFAARPVCCPSCLLQSKGFVLPAPGLWLNRNVSVTSPKFPCDPSSTPDLPSVIGQTLRPTSMILALPLVSLETSRLRSRLLCG